MASAERGVPRTAARSRNAIDSGRGPLILTGLALGLASDRGFGPRPVYGVALRRQRADALRDAAVAQLVERVLGKDEVAGSSPASSFHLSRWGTADADAGLFCGRRWAHSPVFGVARSRRELRCESARPGTDKRL